MPTENTPAWRKILGEGKIDNTPMPTLKECVAIAHGVIKEKVGEFGTGPGQIRLADSDAVFTFNGQVEHYTQQAMLDALGMNAQSFNSGSNFYVSPKGDFEASLYEVLAAKNGNKPGPDPRAQITEITRTIERKLQERCAQQQV